MIKEDTDEKQFESISDKKTECNAYTSLIQNDNVKHYIPEKKYVNAKFDYDKDTLKTKIKNSNFFKKRCTLTK